jgi:IMP dehydrogenase/GMP reductase
VKGVDDLGGLDASAESAGSDTDTGINEGLCAREKPGLNAPVLSAAAVAAFEKEKGVVIASSD